MGIEKGICSIKYLSNLWQKVGVTWELYLHTDIDIACCKRISYTFLNFEFCFWLWIINEKILFVLWLLFGICSANEREKSVFEEQLCDWFLNVVREINNVGWNKNKISICSKIFLQRIFMFHFPMCSKIFLCSIFETVHGKKKYFHLQERSRKWNKF